MPWEYDERERLFQRDQEKISFLAGELGDKRSVLTVGRIINDWIPDPAEDLAVLCTMVNAYAHNDDFEELGRHVANYVRGMWELVARHQVECGKDGLSDE